MTEPKDPDQDAPPGTPPSTPASVSGLRLKRLLCKRTGEQIKPEEHEQCPYCFGRLSEIKKGHHEAFCDYHEGKDPMHFGFPAGEERFEQG